MDSFTISLLPSALAVAVPLFGLLSFLWVIWRTESLHVLKRRLWLLVHGSQEVSDPVIRAYVEEQTSLMAFRMFSGIRASSLEEAQKLLQWAKLNGLELRKIGRCGEYFDPELRQVRVHKLPSLFRQTLQLIAAIALFACALTGVALLPVSQVLFTFKETQHSFLAGRASAQTAWPPAPFNANLLRPSDCSQAVAANAVRTSFSEEEVTLVCQLLKDKGWHEYLRSQLKMQRWSLVLLAAVACWLFFLFIFAWTHGAAAKTLALRRIDPTLPGGQLPLELQV